MTKTAGHPTMGGITHPAAVALVAIVGLASSWILAARDPVPEWELDLTEWFAATPDLLARTIYPPMQVGTIGAALAVSVVVATVGRDRLLGATMAVTVFGTWLATRAVKATVGRGRPSEYLPDIDERDHVSSALGYASSHSSVSAAAGVLLMAALPPRWRWVGPFVVVIAGLGRIIHGVHLPADVVGGWSIGVLFALVGLAVVDRLRVRHGSVAR